jgi:hypothetical protein
MQDNSDSGWIYQLIVSAILSLVFSAGTGGLVAIQGNWHHGLAVGAFLFPVFILFLMVMARTSVQRARQMNELKDR